MAFTIGKYKNIFVCFFYKKETKKKKEKKKRKKKKGKKKKRKKKEKEKGVFKKASWRSSARDGKYSSSGCTGMPACTHSKTTTVCGIPEAEGVK
jgi:hypothetical protein